MTHPNVSFTELQECLFDYEEATGNQIEIRVKSDGWAELYSLNTTAKVHVFKWSEKPELPLGNEIVKYVRSMTREHLIQKSVSIKNSISGLENQYKNIAELLERLGKKPDISPAV